MDYSIRIRNLLVKFFWNLLEFIVFGEIQLNSVGCLFACGYENVHVSLVDDGYGEEYAVVGLWPQRARHRHDVHAVNGELVLWSDNIMFASWWFYFSRDEWINGSSVKYFARRWRSLPVTKRQYRTVNLSRKRKMHDITNLVLKCYKLCPDKRF